MASRVYFDVFEIVSWVFARYLENGIEKMRHRKERWARIKAIAVLLKCRELPARVAVGFEDRYCMPRSPQVDSSRKTCYSRTDYSNFFQDVKDENFSLI